MNVGINSIRTFSGLSISAKTRSSFKKTFLGIDRICRNIGAIILVRSSKKSLPRLRKRLRRIQMIEKQMRARNLETQSLKERIVDLSRAIKSKERRVLGAALSLIRFALVLLDAPKALKSPLRFTAAAIKLPHIVETLNQAASSPIILVDTAVAFLDVGSLTILATLDSDSPEAIAGRQLQCALKTYKIARSLHKLAANMRS